MCVLIHFNFISRCLSLYLQVQSDPVVRITRNIKCDAIFQMATRKSKGYLSKMGKVNLRLAMAAVKEVVGVSEAARTYDVPETILKRYNTG